MARTHLITGATGNLGSMLTLRLLRNTSDRILCVVRDTDPARARARLEDKLTRAAALSGEVPRGDAFERIDAFCWDLVDPLPKNFDRAADVVWHCAASLKHEEEFRDEAYEDNVAAAA